jgi:hypothetical protein
LSTSDPYGSDNTQPPAGYPGAEQPPAPPAYTPEPAPAPPAYGAPAYGAPAAPQQGYPQAPTYGAQGYPAQPYGYAPPAKTNTMAIVSLILSIAGLVIVPFIGSLVGAILGHVSLGQLKTSGEQGRGLAVAGVIIGWVGLALAIIGTIAIVAWFGWIASYSTSYSA